MIMVKKENLFWLLFGIVVAFGIQVLYDGIWEYPYLTLKFWYGLVIEAVLIVGLIIYDLTIMGGDQR
jgi:hypothetical protein